MNKERIALQEILDLCDNENKTHEAIWGIAYEVLSTEVTEPRMFSEEEVMKAVDNAFLHASDWISTFDMPAFTQYKEQYISKHYPLSPKEGKEESSKIDIVEERLNQERVGYQNLKKVFYIDYVRQFVNSYLDEEISISRFCEVLNEDAHNAYVQLAPSLEPNQTEQRIGEDFEQFIIDQINQSYNEHKGSNEAVQDAAYYITKKIESNLSLARKQVIEELEEWVKKEWFGAKEDDMTYHEHVVNADDLLTKLQTLTK